MTFSTTHNNDTLYGYKNIFSIIYLTRFSSAMAKPLHTFSYKAVNYIKKYIMGLESSHVGHHKISFSVCKLKICIIFFFSNKL